MDIKTNCEHWEAEAKNECYMFRPFDCRGCSQYKPRAVKHVAIVGDGGRSLSKVMRDMVVQQLIQPKVSKPKYIDELKRMCHLCCKENCEHRETVSAKDFVNGLAKYCKYGFIRR